MTEAPFPLTRGTAFETYASPAYHYDNLQRGDGDACVIQLTLSGAGFIADRQRTQAVPVDHAMLFTHREPTRYGYPPSATAPYRLCFLALSASPEVTIMFDRLRRAFGAVVRLPPGSHARSLFDAVCTKAREHTFVDRFDEAESIYRLLVALFREQVADSQKSDPIAYGRHVLLDRFRAPINLKEVADRSGVSREHFNRAYHARYREAPGATLRRLRLEHARSMLQASKLPVEDIAVASGFASSNSFCRAYRQHFGHSPGATRGTD